MSAYPPRQVDCPYTSDRCGKGAVTAGQGCYLLLNAGQGKTTYQVQSQMCQDRGGHLASLNTQQEWMHVWRVLQTTALEWVLLGLQPALPTWPNM